MKLLKPLFIVLVVLGAAITTALVFGWQPEPFEKGTASAAQLQPGPLEVRSYDVVFEDTSRATAANGEYAETASRVLDSTVWHPATGNTGPYPLLVYSHGFSSSREGGNYLARHMASLGYVVVAMDFPLTNMNTPGGPNVRDVVNQPGDVRFVIDQLLALSATPGEAVEGLVDASRIGVFGLSLGGMTTELVSFHPDMRDPRIGAALSIAGPTFMMAPAFFAHVPDLPFLMLAGDIDALVPYRANAAPIPGKMPGAELVTVAGASHTGFAGPAAMLRWMHNPDALGCYLVTRRIGDAMATPWYDLFGSEALGIDASADSELCTVDPLPPAMNVLRQHMISQVVVSAFFQREFSQRPDERQAAAKYLRDQSARELPEVDYRVSRR